MSAQATVRVMSAEEIAARSGGEIVRLIFPERSTVFAERAMRLRQLANGHSMADFLVFLSALAQAQQAALTALCGSTGWAVPDAAAIDRASRDGMPPLSAADWPRDVRWQQLLAGIVAQIQPATPSGPATDALARLAAADEVFLERQADALLNGVMAGLDLAAAPVVAAALQVVWTHLAGELGQPTLGLLDDPGICPCCGSRPVASITRSSGESTGQRYLHCGLCNTGWYLERGKCCHCGSGKSIAYQSLDRADVELGSEESASRAAKAAIQVETCDDCGHYLKIVHSDRDPFVDPVADDLASLTLDLLVAETGKLRHGVNLMLLFGEPEPPGPA